MRELHRAFTMSPLTLLELAQELELSEEGARSWIDGDVDLRLSDLRHLANAIGAHVTHQVGAITRSAPQPDTDLVSVSGPRRS